MSESHDLELGVFLPVGSGGWITSTTSPQLDGSYGYNREVAILAEDLGFDFALSMAKWRGYGGPSKHWDTTIESLSTSAGLAEATSRIGIWTTVHTMIFHPAIVAKMMATMDQISGGRMGINLVSGSNPYDQGQMGLWRDLDHTERYALAEEWIGVARALWTEDRVDHSGTYFTLEDCVSDPKPAAMPPIICAGTSDTGFRFTIQHCTGAFFSGETDDKVIESGLRAKRLAAEMGETTKTYALLTLVPGATDAEAADRVSLYNEGVDIEAIARQASEYSKDVTQNSMRTRMLALAENPVAVGKGAIVGSPDTIATRIARIVKEGDLDGITVIVPDFIEDLKTVGEQIAPRLAELGVTTLSSKVMRGEVAA